MAAGIARLRQRHVREMSQGPGRPGRRGRAGQFRRDPRAVLLRVLRGPPRPAARHDAATSARPSCRRAESAYQAIARPVEGTILTVIRDWARHVAARAADVPDFEKLLPESLKAAKAALAEDAQADAGPEEGGRRGRGRPGVRLPLEGIVRYLREAARGAIPEAPPEDTSSRDLRPDARRHPLPLLHGGAARGRLHRPRRAAAGGRAARRLDRDRRRRRARSPPRPHQRAGESSSRSRRGSPTSRRRRSRTCAPSTSRASTRIGRSASGSSPTRPATCRRRCSRSSASAMVPVRVYFGSENYLDKVTITPAEFYARFAVTDEEPKTSQPPPADFTQVYRNVATHAGAHRVHPPFRGVLGDLPGGGRRGARPCEKTRFVHVDSRNVVGRSGPRRARGRRGGGGGKERRRDRARWRGNGRGVRSFVAVPTLDPPGARGTRVAAQGPHREAAGAAAHPDDLARGQGRARAKARGYAGRAAKMMTLLFAAAGGRAGASRRFGVAHCDAEDTAEEIAREIRERYPGVRRDDRRVRSGPRSPRRSGGARGGGSPLGPVKVSDARDLHGRPLESLPRGLPRASQGARRSSASSTFAAIRLSRKWPHFDAEPPGAAALAEEGIEYFGMPELGGRRRRGRTRRTTAWREESLPRLRRFHGHAGVRSRPRARHRARANRRRAARR